MKKLLLISCFLGAISGEGVNAQMNTKAMGFNYLSFPNAQEVALAGSSTAVHTRSANYDYDQNNTLVGIVWCGENGNAEVYFATIPASNLTPSAYEDPSVSSTFVEVNYAIDPGYIVGFPDISIIKPDPSSSDLVATVVYQRKPSAGSQWEVAYKKFTIDNTNSLSTNISNPIVLGAGKAPTIDAFLELPNFFPQPGPIPFISNKNVIAFSNNDGYELRVVDINDALLESANIPLNIANAFPDYITTDDIMEIDVAAVCRRGRGASGAFALDAVHIIYAYMSYPFSASIGYKVATWENIDYDNLTSHFIDEKLELSSGTSQTGRCKIEAMSVQDYNTTGNHFVALTEHDLGTIVAVYGHNGPFGHTATSEFLFNYGFNYPYTSDNPFLYVPVSGFDITAGVGVLGNQDFYSNRYHSVAQEVWYTNSINSSAEMHLFRYGVDRDIANLAQFDPMVYSLFQSSANRTLNCQFYSSEAVSTISYTAPLYTTRFPSNLRQSYFAENVSSSASLNTGKFLIKTWIDAGQAVRYKCFNAEEDIDVPGGSIQWKAPSTAGTSTLYPNPVQDVLSIEDKTDAIMGYTIYSIEGRKLQAETGIDATAYPIDVKHLTMGSYILMTQHASGATQKHKFIKQ